MTLLRMAVANLVQGGRRVYLLTLALALASFACAMVSGLLSGICDRLIEAGSAYHSGHINVGGYYRTPSGKLMPVVLGAEKKAELLSAMPEVKSVSGRILSMASAVSEGRAVGVFLDGVDIGAEPDLLSFLVPAPDATGLVPRQEIEHVLREPKRMVLFEDMANRMRVGVGDSVTVWTRTPLGTTNTVEMTVGAIAKGMGGLTHYIAYCQKETLRELLQLPADSESLLLVRIADKAEVGRVLTRIEAVLRAQGLDVSSSLGRSSFRTVARAPREVREPHLFLNTYHDQLEILSWRLAAARGLSLILFVILGSIVAVGCLNSMLVSVKQRTHEIGTLRAMGMQRIRVAGLFLTEGCLLGGVAASLGAGAAALASYLLNLAAIPIRSDAFRDVYFSDTLTFSMSPRVAVGLIVGFAVLAAAATLWPALSAARLRPAVAFRQVT